MNNIESFAALGLHERLTATLAALGYEEPTPIQAAAIPHLLAGRDVVGQAATGTGKTAAFALPIIHTLAAAGGARRAASRRSPAALVLVPTRELANQVAEAFGRYGDALGVSVLALFGGQSYEPQIRALSRGVDVVVATPGRALDHVRRETLRLDAVRTVVLDEADEMLDMGFVDDIEELLGATGEDRRVVLFSATMPPRIAAIAKRHLRDPANVRIERAAPVDGEMPRVRQTAYVVPRAHKLPALVRLLDVERPRSAIVFCRTRDDVDEVTDRLCGRGHRAEALHGGMTQVQRDRVMKKLRSGEANLVVATDVAARGLDVDQLSHVVNFDVPQSVEAYVHRIGRVGRAGREGTALLLAVPAEARFLRGFERAVGQPLPVARVPTLAELRARRFEAMRGVLRETVLAGGLDDFRAALESLAGEIDPLDLAAAAAKLASVGMEGEGEGDEIRSFTPAEERRGGRGERGGYRAERGGDHAERGGDRPERGDRAERNRDFAPDQARGRVRGSPRPLRQTEGMIRLFLDLGRAAGVRPQDLVGAITGEAGIAGREIGAIDIAERFSLVEIAEHAADDVIAALGRTRIKGKRIAAKRDRRVNSGR